MGDVSGSPVERDPSVIEALLRKDAGSCASFQHYNARHHITRTDFAEIAANNRAAADLLVRLQAERDALREAIEGLAAEGTFVSAVAGALEDYDTRIDIPHMRTVASRLRHARLLLDAPVSPVPDAPGGE